MIIATPFIPGLTDYDAYAADLKKRGKLNNHVHVVLSAPEDEEAAYKLGTSLADLFGKTFSVKLEEQTRSRMQVANDLFCAAARYVTKYKVEEGEMEDPALLYMDPNYRPQRNGWVNELQSEYYVLKAPPVFGTGTPDADGAILFEGPLVISKEFYPSSGLASDVPPTQFWRQYLKWDLTKDAKQTELIGTESPAMLRKITPKKTAA